MVCGLAWSTDADILRDAFEQYGPLEDAYIMRDRETGKHLGYGYLEYGHEDAASKAILWMNNRWLDGRIIRVVRADEKAPDAPLGRFAGGRRRRGGKVPLYVGSSKAYAEGEQSFAESQ